MVPIAPNADAATRDRVRRFVADVLHLQPATGPEGTNVRRPPVAQAVSRDRPIYLTDRRGSFDARRAVHLDKPVFVLYQDAPGIQRFQKAKKPKEEATGCLLDSKQAFEEAKSFFIENGLLGAGANEEILDEAVLAKYGNRNSSQREKDGFLSRQDVLLARSFEGRPVINSTAMLGILPQTREVVMLAVSDWSPAIPENATTVKPAYGDLEARQMAEQLSDRLRATLRRDGDFASAYVGTLKEGWYQDAGRGLIPVLIFTIQVKPGGEDAPYIARLAMNPLGSDESLGLHARLSSKHSFAHIPPLFPQ